jgi:protein transport protein SEC20
MPPIPTTTTFSDPDVVDAIASLQQRETYLSSIAIPNLATLPAVTSLSEQQKLAEDLREDLEDFGKRVEGLEQLVEDLDTEKERVKGRAIVLQWADTYARLKKEARAVALSSKKVVDQSAKSRRDELLGSAVYNPGRQEDEKIDDALMRTNANLTDALRRTEERLRAELDRSMLSTQLLTSQTSTLKQTTEAHNQLTSLLDMSKNLIVALERTDWLDRVLIIGALVVFLLACAWIVKVRVFDRAVRIAFWWVKWMPSFKDDSIIDELEKGARAVTSTFTSVTASVSASVTSVLSSAIPTLSEMDGLPDGSSIAETATAILDPTSILKESSITTMDDLTTATSLTIDIPTAISSAVTTSIRSYVRDEL